MPIQREISWFHKDSEELAGELNVDHIPLHELLSIFTPYANDPLLYFVYNIYPEHAERLTNWVSLCFDFTAYTYQLDCWQG